jgi:hypothetical protein
MSLSPAVANTLDCTKNMPRVGKEKTPWLAWCWGFVLGPIGLGIYLRSWPDFLIPFMLMLMGALVGAGVSGTVMCTLCGCYGAMRVINSRKAAAELAAARRESIPTSVAETGSLFPAVQ